jgi:hypothetical protein
VLSPDLTVYDANGNAVNAQILSNDAGGYVVQVLNPVANATYYVAVSASAFAAGSNDQGTYRLGVTYTNTPIVLQGITNGTLSATDTVNTVTLQSSQAQLYHFVLSADTGGVASGISVVMQLYDASGNLVLALTCQDGNTVSADVQLLQGSYTVRFTAVSSSGAPIPTTSYSLLGANLSNPLDPVPVDPTDPNVTTTTGTTTTGTTTTPPTLTTVVPTSPPVQPPSG